MQSKLWHIARYAFFEVIFFFLKKFRNFWNSFGLLYIVLPKFPLINLGKIKKLSEINKIYSEIKIFKKFYKI